MFGRIGRGLAGAVVGLMSAVRGIFEREIEMPPSRPPAGIEAPPRDERPPAPRELPSAPEYSTVEYRRPSAPRAAILPDFDFVPRQLYSDDFPAAADLRSYYAPNIAEPPETARLRGVYPDWESLRDYLAIGGVGPGAPWLYLVESDGAIEVYGVDETDRTRKKDLADEVSDQLDEELNEKTEGAWDRWQEE